MVLYSIFYYHFTSWEMSQNGENDMLLLHCESQPLSYSCQLPLPDLLLQNCCLLYYSLSCLCSYSWRSTRFSSVHVKFHPGFCTLSTIFQGRWNSSLASLPDLAYHVSWNVIFVVSTQSSNENNEHYQMYLRPHLTQLSGWQCGPLITTLWVLFSQHLCIQFTVNSFLKCIFVLMSVSSKPV